MPAFLGDCDYPNSGMCGGLLARILILLQTPFVHLVVKQIRDRRQLIKTEALSKVIMGSFCKHQGLPHKTDSDQRQTINQSCFMGSFFGHRGPPPTFRPWDKSTVSRLSFSDRGNAT